MGDIANLGFATDTSGLEKANVALDGVAAKAGKADTATARFRATMDAVSATAKVLDAAARNLSAASDKLAASMGATSNASNTLQSATQRVTVNFNQNVTAITKATQATQAQTSADLKAADAKSKLATATSRVNVVMPGSSGSYPQRPAGYSFNNSATGGSGSFASEVGAATTVMATTVVGDFGKEAEQTAAKVAKLTDGVHVNSLAMREFVTIGRELSAGNFTRLPGSISLLAQSFGLLNYIINPVTIGIGALTLGVYEYVKAVNSATEENNRFANTLSTTGNYAGLTIDRYHAMAAAIGAATDTTTKSNEGLISSLANTNKFTGDEISQLVTSAQLWGQATGQSADKVLDSFAKAADGPGKYATEFSDQYTNVITPAQAAHIKLLDDTGDHQAALAELIRVQYAGILSTTQNSTSAMGKAWDTVTVAIGNAIHALVQYQAQTKADSATSINSTRGGILSFFQNLDPTGGKGFQPYINQTLADQNAITIKKMKDDSDALWSSDQNGKIKERAEALNFLTSNYKSAYDSQLRFKNDVAALDKALANADQNDPRVKEARAHRADIIEGLRQQDMPEAYKASIAKPKAIRHTDAERVDQTLTGDISQVQAQIAAYNLSADAALKAGNEQKYLNNATRDFKSISDKQRTSIIAQADALTDLQIKLKNLQGYKEIIDGADKSIASLTAQGQAIGKVGEASYYLKDSTDLLNQAITKKITLDDAERAGIDAKARSMAQLQAANDNAKAYMDAMNSGQENIANLTAQKNALGQSVKAQNDAAYAQKLLNDEVFRGISYTPDQIKGLEAVNSAQYDLTVQIQNQKDAMDFLRSSATGFVSDLQSGLKQGESLFEAFGKAVENVLDKVITKLLDVALDAAMGGSSGGVGGFLGNIAKSLGIGGGAGINIGASNASLTSSLASSNAAGFAALGFAKGGAFTNSIVDSPTLFKFAKGTALGEMGEKGPEAVMPLKRGADGSLGVQMYGQQARGGDTHYHQGDVYQEFPISGAIDVSAVAQAIRQSAEQTKQDIKKAQQGWAFEYQQNGAVA